MSAREQAEEVIEAWAVDIQSENPTDDVMDRLEAAGLRLVEAGEDPEGAETEVVTGRDAPAGRGPGTPREEQR